MGQESVNPADFSSSNREEDQLETLQGELKRVDESILNFDEQRNRTLTILRKRLEKEKIQNPPAKIAAPSIKVSNLRPLQTEVDKMKKELSAIEYSMKQKQDHLEELSAKITEQKAEIKSLEKANKALDDFDEIQERRNALAEEVETLRAEISELESKEKGLSEKISIEEDRQ